LIRSALGHRILGVREGAQPRALTGKQHTVLGFSRAVCFGRCGPSRELSGSWHVGMVMGTTQPLVRDREVGAGVSSPRAGAKAQTGSQGGVALGRARRHQTLWRRLCSEAGGWVPVLPCSLPNLFSQWPVPSREHPRTGQSHH